MSKTLTIILHLKKEYYDMVISGKKRIDFREVKPYWQKRLSNNNFKYIKIMCGYNPATSLLFKFDGITIFNYITLPNYAKIFFNNSECSFFFGIRFCTMSFNGNDKEVIRKAIIKDFEDNVFCMGGVSGYTESKLVMHLTGIKSIINKHLKED